MNQLGGGNNAGPAQTSVHVCVHVSVNEFAGRIEDWQMAEVTPAP